jgi:hypothetical protein
MCIIVERKKFLTIKFKNKNAGRKTLVAVEFLLKKNLFFAQVLYCGSSVKNKSIKNFFFNKLS